MVRFFDWVRRVYEGWKNVLTGNLSEETKRRMKICEECTNKTRITKNEYFCNSCGCIIRAKCASHDEVCDLNKW